LISSFSFGKWHTQFLQQADRESPLDKLPSFTAAACVEFSLLVKAARHIAHCAFVGSEIRFKTNINDKE
jgi:hypothetical protein